MMPAADPENILVVQTAFLGDLILTLPLVQTIKAAFPAAQIDMLVVPKTSDALQNNPSLRSILVFDKRGVDSGIGGFIRRTGAIKKHHYDTAFLPHRSLRSAALARFAGIPRRIGFQTSAGRLLQTDTVKYDPSAHEIDRNLSLLGAVGVSPAGRQFPELYPSRTDRDVVEGVLRSSGLTAGEELIAIAPGTVWNTKRWPPDRFAELAAKLVSGGSRVVLVGGRGDSGLITPYLQRENLTRIIDTAGQLTILQSAELIRRCRVLVCNDSAPMHLAVAVRTPVVAIFGATIPEFGFAPIGERDIVLETKGLSCRPCSIHGGDVCPVKTFVCMLDITVDRVVKAVEKLLEAGSNNASS
jgi:heptosyltransferase-2